jgi:hypothetical protein
VLVRASRAAGLTGVLVRTGRAAGLPAPGLPGTGSLSSVS